MFSHLPLYPGTVHVPTYAFLGGWFTSCMCMYAISKKWAPPRHVLLSSRILAALAGDLPPAAQLSECYCICNGLLHHTAGNNGVSDQESSEEANKEDRLEVWVSAYHL